MALQARYAALAAVVVCIAALVYIRLPGFPESTIATSTPAAATSTDGVASSTENAASGIEISAPSAGPSVTLGGKRVRVTIADTPDARWLGLGGREALAPDEGMLFVFPVADRYGFWMKDMKFSIDIVWINDAGTIIDIETDVSPASYPTSFTPEAPARYVLEVPAGFTKVYTVQKGDRVEL